MMTELKIGECKCIYHSDKDDILLALSNDIERHEQRISEIKLGIAPSSMVASPETLIKMHKSLKERMEAVKRRVESTPECK